MQHINLETFANGAFTAQVNRAIEEVTKNIQDPNTDAGTARKITVKGAFLEREKPVTLRIIARYLPPKSVSKKRKLDMLEGRELPLKKPDMDNIVKVVADALNGVAYHDDTQIALVQAKKCYSAVEGLDVTVEEYTG